MTTLTDSDITQYCNLNDKNGGGIKYDYGAFDHGSNIQKENMFLISNYCFSEISQENRNKYVEILFPKVLHVFLLGIVFPYMILDLNMIAKKNIL